MIAALCSKYGAPSWDFSSNTSTRYPAGSSLLERLPSELLSKVLTLVTIPVQKSNRQISMPESTNAKKSKAKEEEPNLFSVLQTSRKLYQAALPILYHSPKLTSPTQFSTFVSSVSKNPSLGTFIRVLDLTHLAPTRSITGPWDTKSSSPLSTLLSHTPLLRNLSLDQYLADEVDETVLRLLLQLKFLEVLEFNNCNSPLFTRGLSGFFGVGNAGRFTSLARLSLRGCGGISGDILGDVLSLAPRLRSLDLAGTRIEVSGLESLLDGVRLAELDLSYCEELDGRELAHFLSTHPAVVNGELKALGIAERAEERSLGTEDLAMIFSSLPNGVKDLNLRNTKLEGCHIEAMRLRGVDLEVLSVGSQVNMRDLEALLLGNSYKFLPERQEGEAPSPGTEEAKHEHASVLSTMEKAIKICKLRQRLNSTTPRCSTAIKTPALRYLDISSMSIPEQGKIQRSVLLGGELGNLEVIEMSNLVLSWSEMLGEVCRCVGWKIRWVGRRCWLERV